MKVGLEVLRLAPADWLPGRPRVGLVANCTSVMTDFRTLPSVLWSALGRGPDAVFTDPVHWQLRRSAPPPPPSNRLPLYRFGPDQLAEVLPDLDLLLFDLQDVGCSFFYLPDFLRRIMLECGRADVKLLVLDRPNPLGGIQVAGPRLAAPLPLPPLLHGLTVGELARWLLATGQAPCELDVVPMRGWRRTATWQDLSRSWIAPAPTLPRPESVLLYPATGILEMTNVSCGRGTSRPFELVGAPWSPLHQLAKRLQGADIHNVVFRSALFQPSWGQWQGRTCAGVQAHVLDPAGVDIWLLGLQLLAILHDLGADSGFCWEQEGAIASPVGDETHHFALDALVSTWIRPWLEAGPSPDSLHELCSAGREEWLDERTPYLLYSEPRQKKVAAGPPWAAASRAAAQTESTTARMASRPPGEQSHVPRHQKQGTATTARGRASPTTPS